MKYLQDSVKFNLARGKYGEAIPVKIKGQNLVVGTAWETLHSLSNASPGMLAADAQLDVVSDDAADIGWYQAILTLSANLSDTDTIVVNGKTYTAQTVLTDVDGNFLIGGTASDTIDNLIAANTLGAGAGTLYATSTTAHGTVGCSAGAGDTMIARELVYDSGAAYTATETSATASWDVATFATGTGLRMVRVHYIASIGGVIQNASEDVVLDGATTVILDATGRSIAYAEVVDYGTGGGPAGTITLSVDEAPRFEILAGEARTDGCFYSIAADQRFVVTKYGFSTFGSTVDVLGRLKWSGGINTPVNSLIPGVASDNSNSFEHEPSVPIEIVGPAEIQVQVQASGASGVVYGYLEGFVLESIE
jgi:hypothetical protein